ncbi:MAG: hypothetical protein HOP08_14040 [Cyclobacteriaceae bacterium]|nr:hypothetical protein [Cyclobacteriaceae bacterium]
MKRPEIINHKIVNSVEQLARFLKRGDIFRKPRGATQYKFEELVQEQNIVICENLDTHRSEEIYFNSPVFRLMMI